MANISRIADRIWTGGDLPYQCGPGAMLADLDEIRAAGIVHIIDNRIEASDEDFVARHAPEIAYTWNGQDDAGQRMPDAWFDRGVRAAAAHGSRRCTEHRSAVTGRRGGGRGARRGSAHDARGGGRLRFRPRGRGLTFESASGD